MRRSDKEITDKGIIESILMKSEICRLGIMDSVTPYIVPLNYGYADGKLYFHSSKEGKKIELLKQNSKVAFEIEISGELIRGDMPCNWTARYRSVMGTGIAEIVHEEQEIINGLNIIMSHYGNNQKSYDNAYLKRIVIIKLTIENLSGKQSGEWGLS